MFGTWYVTLVEKKVLFKKWTHASLKININTKFEKKQKYRVRISIPVYY